MSSKPHYFAIGLFVLIGASLGFVGIIALSSDALRDPSVFIETYTDESVQGIDIGTPLKFRGVKIGSVHQIHLVTEEYETAKMYVMLRCAVDDKLLENSPEEFSRLIKVQVEKGLRVKMVPQGITGLSYLDMDLLPEGLIEPLGLDWEPAHIYVPSTPSMMSVLGRSLENITAQMNTIDIAEIGNNIELITSNLNLSVQDIQMITGGAAEISEDVEKNIHSLSANLAAMAVELRSTAENSESDAEQIMSNLRYITDDVRELIRLIKRNPGMLLTEPPDKILSH